MSVVLWPRQEVLQLVIPQLGSVGRHLNANTANNLIRRLTKLQTPEGKISFDRWLVVAKEVLRWNDHCIHLFWDMVSLSTFYMSRESALLVKREDTSLDLEFVAIFLFLHLHDGPALSLSQKSPTVAYEDSWPNALPGAPTPEDDVPTSPISPKNSAKSKPFNSPISPRSPRNLSPRNRSGSPTSGARAPKSSAQYLHAVRDKIPLILRSLSIEQQEESTMTDLTLSIDTSRIDDMGALATDFAIAKKTVDALGLIVCGGHSRDQNVSNLSSLFSAFQGGDKEKEGASMPFSELSAWIDLHMSMNDTLYPVSRSPAARELNISMSPEVEKDAATVAKGQQPSRICNSVSSLSRSKPTIINGCTTTVVHVIGSLSRPSSFKRGGSGRKELTGLACSSLDRAEHSGLEPRPKPEHSDSDSDSLHDPIREKQSPDGRLRNLSNLSDSSFDENGLDELCLTHRSDEAPTKETTLPPLYLNFCSRAKMYLISPYHSASISGCSDCDIVIGAVFGAVIVSNCERVRITCACRKLLIINCLDCAFNVATLTTTIIAGDSRGVVVGPYNTAYKSLRMHLKLAGLEPLLSTEEPSANPKMASLPAPVDREGSPNCWASLCDVVACLESPVSNCSPSGYAMDAAVAPSPLPPPLPSTARLLPYEDFRPTTVPVKQEFLAFEHCPIRTPAEYLGSLRQQQQSLELVKAQVASVLVPTYTPSSSPLNAVPDPAAGEAEDRKKRAAATSTEVSKKFMEWLVNSGNAKQVLDLIRIDAERVSVSQSAHPSTHPH
ncbi:tubulin binding cofactor C-domain-containing protein [Ochromonadaceae sp. CCMP2298]|nr:tubulin binding cofactor C-domain-containing protein [Ochromonadaceae sp. CCMP2298]|mmetsp:Transcript_7359/g.16071  ORF Transcript_7359/g.16071 Transcript_7359/m.16071 type:complete len:780 (+) Transcript_7359:176-2515(+)|eukprot:CAMPEP_0173173982 /NCGR_PEP_ID=MMETSP1141-20130122/3115_1 /TAXON_ID=483371 /ORGANISM="non described non described, Strain CCMP2298" /LENGTH=779 /DNA_ID=CAMNT_0014096087 /DNA_START=82 /DNA_END=2421 /DNA_ORIENTATION=-